MPITLLILWLNNEKKNDYFGFGSNRVVRWITISRFGKRLKCHCSAVFFLVLVAVCLIALTIGFVVTMFPSVCIIINILHCDDYRYSIYIDWRSVFSSFSPVLFFFECDSFYPLEPCPVSLKLVLVLTAFVQENPSAIGGIRVFLNSELYHPIS